MNARPQPPEGCDDSPPRAALTRIAVARGEGRPPDEAPADARRLPARAP